MPRAYCITEAAIEAERARSGGDPARFDVARVVELEEVERASLPADGVRVRVLAVSVEHNVVHAALADTVNIVRLRGGKICPGNTFIGEVIETGPQAVQHRAGDIVICGGTSVNDPFGYPLRVPGYDKPNSNGCYAEELVCAANELRPAPLDCGLDLFQIVAAPLRAWTAHHLWRRALGMFRVKVSREKLARLNVLAFGGGTSEFFLMLARAEGHRAFYCAGSAARRDELARAGIEPIDQTAFDRFRTPDDVRRFARDVRRRTGGAGMHVVCDMFRGPLFDAGIAALAREGVNVSAGWQLATAVQYSSPALTLNQITIDHVHFETVDGCGAALELLGSVFVPHLHKEIYAFEDLPRALDELHRNVQTGLPVVRVADEMPASVAHLVPQA
jgi:NADPH:quinone reductase-like Zn-dependent oxidoreductase